VGQRWTLDTADKRKHFMEHVTAQVLAGKAPTVEFVTPTQSEAQSNATWLWCEQCSLYLNDAGLDQRVVLDPAMPISWTKTAFMDAIWRKVKKAMTSTDTTKDTKKPEVSDIYETIVRHINTSQGVTLPPFPRKEHHGT
jgi:hypothetical protein